MSDKFIHNLIEKWIPALGHFLQKIAFIAIFVGFLGYFINSISDIDLSGIRLSPISDKSLEKISPSTPPAKR